MISDDLTTRLKNMLPFLMEADPILLREFKEEAFFARIPAGKDVFVEGDRAEALALLLSGVVRVYKIGETGREITLYRFGLGESCILTANAILGRQSFPAIATVEQDAEAVLIPANAFRDWVKRYDQWRDFLFRLLSQRLEMVLEIVDAVTFRRVDARIAGFLLQRAQSQHPVRITHQEIAAELGTSREVVSRILEGFAGEGLVQPGRGVLEIRNVAGLRSRALL